MSSPARVKLAPLLLPAARQRSLNQGDIEVLRMSSLSQNAVVRPTPGFAGRNGLLDRYFYFGMSLLVAAIVVAGFSRTVEASLFHATPPRPFLLWIHATAFSAWVAFYIFQSALVRTRNVKWHRFFGWFGVGLGAAMVPLGFVIAIIMGRFDAVQLHQSDPTFLSVPFSEILAFGVLLTLAVYWRRKPELHRRLLLIATCTLLDAPFDRFDFIYYHNLGYVFVDMVLLLGVARDVIVSRRIHPVYLLVPPSLIVLQGFVMYLWHGSPAWWLRMTQAMLA